MGPVSLSIYKARRGPAKECRCFQKAQRERTFSAQSGTLSCISQAGGPCSQQDLAGRAPARRSPFLPETGSDPEQRGPGTSLEIRSLSESKGSLPTHPCLPVCCPCWDRGGRWSPCPALIAGDQVTGPRPVLHPGRTGSQSGCRPATHAASQSQAASPGPPSPQRARLGFRL